MTRRKSSPAKPWAKKQAAARVISPDQQWALGIVRRMLVDCHPWQLDAAVDPAKRISFLVGRGGAKTTTQRVRALAKVLLLKNQYIGYAATSADQARELNWDPIKRVCEAYGILDEFTFGDTKMVMRCKRTGSTYRLRGVEDKRDAEKFRGFPQAEFQVDECGSFPPELLEYLADECVAPRLGEALAFPPWLLERLADETVPLEDLAFEPERGGTIVLGSSPPKRTGGIFYNVTRPGSPEHRPYSKRKEPEYVDWIGYSSHTWNLRDVAALPQAREKYPALVALLEAQLLEFKRKGWDENHPTRKREYDGVWSEDNTTNVFSYRIHVDDKPWNQWDPFGRPIEGLEGLKLALQNLPKNVGAWHFGLGMDSGGTRDPFAMNVFAFAPADPWRRLIHVFWLEKMRMHGKPIAEVLIGPDPETHPGTPRGGVFSVIGWPDTIEFDADQPSIDELANVYGIKAKKCDRRADYKFGAIELVNGDLLAAAPDGELPGAKIWILKGSPLEQQLQDLQWKADEYGILRENKAQANHSTDTIIYVRGGIATLFDTGGVTEEVPSAQVYVDPSGLGDGYQPHAREEDQFAGLLAEAQYDDDDPWAP